MKDAGQHLLSHGHREIALVRGPTNSWAGQQRAEAVRAWADDAEVKLAEVGPYPPTQAGGRDATDEVLGSGATAAFAYDDLVACGLLAGLNDRGVNVPGDFSLVGCNDVLLAEAVSPALTTVSAPMRTLGHMAVDVLVQHMEGEPVGDMAIPADLVIRESTAPVLA